MPKFIYTAKSYDGQTKGGELVASDEKNLAQQLRSEGFLVTSIKEIVEKDQAKESEKPWAKFFNSVPLKEKMVFARNLSVMVASGLTVTRAVGNLAMQTENKNFRKILLDINEQIQTGKTLSESLAKFQNVFGELFINMVGVGEMAGNLDEVLKIVAVQLEKEHDLKSKVKGAMIYPAVILSVMLIIGVIMMTFVLPKLLGVFQGTNAQLPLMTQVVVNISNAMRDNFVLVILFLLALFIALPIYSGTKQGKKMISWISVKVPIFSPIVKQTNCARFARIYSSLLRSGVGAVDALKIISHTLGNYYYQQVLLGSIEDIQKGVSLSKVLADHTELFPILVSQIVQVGEETGKTETVLLQLAEFYEDEVDQVTKNLSAVIEPLLMVVIGGAVGFFAIAMLQPMYSMMDNIK